MTAIPVHHISRTFTTILRNLWMFCKSLNIYLYRNLCIGRSVNIHAYMDMFCLYVHVLTYYVNYLFIQYLNFTNLFTSLQYCKYNIMFYRQTLVSLNQIFTFYSKTILHIDAISVQQILCAAQNVKQYEVDKMVGYSV